MILIKIMSAIKYHCTHFVTSAPNINVLPKNQGIEIAFIGYSNVGKSSTINTLTNKNRLAYISKYPGSTKLINLFKVSIGKYIVDLPGYGYSKLPIDIQKNINNIIKKYLTYRKQLTGLVIVMDIRYPLKPLDLKVISWAIKSKISVLILLTKADKLKPSQCIFQLNKVKNFTLSMSATIKVAIFSSLKKIGRKELNAILNSWFLRMN